MTELCSHHTTDRSAVKVVILNLYSMSHFMANNHSVMIVLSVGGSAVFNNNSVLKILTQKCE